MAAMTSSVSIENTLRTAFAELECVRVASRRVASRAGEREDGETRDARDERRLTRETGGSNDA